MGGAASGRGALGRRNFRGKLARTGSGVSWSRGDRTAGARAAGGEASSAGSTLRTRCGTGVRGGTGRSPRRRARSRGLLSRVRAAAFAVVGGGPIRCRRSVARPLAGIPSDPS